MKRINKAEKIKNMGNGVRRQSNGCTPVLGLQLNEDYELPCVRWWGHNRLEVENHGGVLEFGPNTVRLYTVLGILKISGDCLSIKLADRETIVCSGKIQLVQYEN